MYIVVPAFNERDNIPLLLDDLRARTAGLDARLVVVDDGSTDGTADEVERRATGMAMQLVRHPVNQGLGAAVRSGFAAVLGEADDDAPVVTIEADTTSDLDDLPVMLERLRAGADVVTTSYLAPGGGLLGVSRWRVLASRGVSLLFRVVTGMRDLHQVTPLYRAYRAGALRAAAARYGDELITETGFTVNVELLLKLEETGAQIVEVPTTLDWTGRRGHSKLPVARTVWRYLVVLARLAGERLARVCRVRFTP